MTKVQRTQKVAYNILFSDCHINGLSLEKILSVVDKYYSEKLLKKWKTFDIELLKNIISLNYDDYKENWFIAYDYETIYKRLKIS